jgi:predicted 2-oxoglutarate/Fe(II)-dependent dioxygenase YbiX
MNVYKNMVYEYENFLPDHMHKQIQELMLQALIDHNVTFQTEGYETVLKIKGNQEVISKLQEKIKTLFISNVRVQQIVDTLVYHQGRSKPSHVDDGEDPTIKYGAVYYVNDDYEGGEINYPSLNLTIKPKSNSLVVHPGDLPHQVFPVTSQSTRFVLTSFIHSDTNENILITKEELTDGQI